MAIPDEWPDMTKAAPVLEDTWSPHVHLMYLLPGEILAIDPRGIADGEPVPLAEWYLDLKRLHDRFVPSEAQFSSGFHSAGFWVGFLSVCITHDPPRDQLLEFAKLEFPELVLRSISPVKEEFQKLLKAKPAEMFGSPIVYLFDAESAAFHSDSRNYGHWAITRDYLWKKHELDLNDIAYEAVREYKEVWDDLNEFIDKEVADEDPLPYIRVTAETTRDDVLRAFDVLKRGLPPAKRGRPARSELLCAQMAIWQTEFQQSHREIGLRLGWAITGQQNGKQWSERIRAHIADGRELLNQKKGAA